MFYVYILKDKFDKIYIGYTNNIERRFSEHQRKQCYYSSRLIEPNIYYFEAYNNQELARQREKKLKQFGSSYHGLIKRLALNKQ